MKEIGKLRKRIDGIDLELIELLAKRKVFIDKIGKIKSDLGTEIFDKQREKEIYTKVKELTKKHNLEPEYVTSIFRIIMQNSRNEQNKLK